MNYDLNNDYSEHTKEDIMALIENEYFNDFELGKSGIIVDVLNAASLYNKDYPYELRENKDGSFRVVTSRGVLITDDINSVDELLSKLNVEECAAGLLKRELEYAFKDLGLAMPETPAEWKEQFLDPQSDLVQSIAKDKYKAEDLNISIEQYGGIEALAVLEFAGNEEAKATIDLQEVVDVAYPKEDGIER